MKTISVQDTVNGCLAITSSQGEAIFQKIDSLLSMGESVTLDFNGIEIVSTRFLNQIYGIVLNPANNRLADFDNIKISTSDDFVEEQINLGVEKIVRYFKQPQAYEYAISNN